MTRVLLIDDFLSPISSLIDMLEKSEFKITYCINPDLTIEKVNEFIKKGEKIDIIILDIMMPYGSLPKDETKDGDITGLVLLNIIQEKFDKPIPTLIYTVMNNEAVIDNENIKDKSKNIPCVKDYLVKPKTSKEIIKKIEEILSMNS